MKHKILVAFVVLGALTTAVTAQDRVELESIYIKGNKEFPQIIYIVPWKDMKTKDHKEQTLVLHSLFGNLFDPVYALSDGGGHGLDSKK
jgi:hypothetical protein